MAKLLYTVGAGAKKQGFLDADIIIGIPLSVTGKNPYFDITEASVYQEARVNIT
jgi:uncharacterized ferredoxin-like protein